MSFEPRPEEWPNRQSVRVYPNGDVAAAIAGILRTYAARVVAMTTIGDHVVVVYEEDRGR